MTDLILSALLGSIAMGLTLEILAPYRSVRRLERRVKALESRAAVSDPVVPPRGGSRPRSASAPTDRRGESPRSAESLLAEMVLKRVEELERQRLTQGEVPLVPRSTPYEDQVMQEVEAWLMKHQPTPPPEPPTDRQGEVWLRSPQEQRLLDRFGPLPR